MFYVFENLRQIAQLLTDADKDCSLSVPSQPFYERHIEPIAFPMRNDWLHAKKFNDAMRRLKEAGELQLIYNK